MTPTLRDTLVLLAAHERVFGRGAHYADLTYLNGEPYATWAYRVRKLQQSKLIEGRKIRLFGNELEFKLTPAGWRALDELGVQQTRRQAA